MEIVKEFFFEAAHRLTDVPEGHKCGRMHGHSFRFEVHLQGAVDPEQGWVMDFGEVSSVVKPIIREFLDHRCLNDIPGIKNPTSEALSVWLWERIKPLLPRLHAVVVHETCTARAIYTGPKQTP